jgi:hypothetical protein
MTNVKAYIDNVMDDPVDQIKFAKYAGGAIAQFLVIRQGLEDRVDDSALDVTAATLTAAVVDKSWK